jgi:hypothetical protein
MKRDVVEVGAPMLLEGDRPNGPVLCVKELTLERNNREVTAAYLKSGILLGANTDVLSQTQKKKERSTFISTDSGSLEGDCFRGK